MAVYKCPSCGARYNGKRCRNCLYEHFTEEIAHGSHVHKGEPLVIDAPVRKPIRRKDPFDCDERTKKQGNGRFAVLLTILLALLGPALDIAENVLSDFSDTISYAVAEPEPVMAVPEDALALYGDDTFQVMAQWKNGQEYTEDGIRIWVENRMDQDLSVYVRDVIVNGYMMDTAFYYCDVRAGSLAMSTLYLSEEGLENAGIRAVTDISFCLEAMDQDSFDVVLITHQIELLASPSANTVIHVAPEGQLIYDQDGIRVSFLGYHPAEYDPQTLSNGQFLFHIENDTDRHLQVYPLEVLVNGELSDVSFWCQLYPGTKAVSTMYLYSLEELGVDTPEALFPMTLTLEFADPKNYDFYLQSDILTLTEG